MKKKKMPKEERKKKLSELLEMAQLTQYENYYIHEISGGMKQRVHFCAHLPVTRRYF